MSASTLLAVLQDGEATMTNAIEESIAVRMRRGDTRAFDELVQRTEGPLLRFAWKFSGEREAAEDIVQESYLRLLREISAARTQSPDGDDQLEFWLLRVCRNLCVDHRRKEARLRQRHQRAASSEIEPAAAVFEHQETQAVLRGVFDTLPDLERRLLELSVQQGLSYREICKLTGFSLHNVSTAIHRGLSRMSQRLLLMGIDQECLTG